MSHELRTPLNAILGWAHLLELNGLDLDPTRQRYALRTIARNAQIQVQLVDDLPDVSRIIPGKLRLQIQPTGLAEVLHAAVDAVRPAAAAKHLELRVSVDPPAATIAADPDRLQQVVWNLLSNAIKFTPRGGVIDLQARQSPLATDILVKDTGAGIPPDVVPFVFERFRQGDSSTTRRHGGVRPRARHRAASRGTARRQRRGIERRRRARRDILRPAAVHELVPRQPRPSSQPASPSGDRAVAIVDQCSRGDRRRDADTREVLSTIFDPGRRARLGCRVHGAGHGRNDARSSDVIADIGMPNEDGYVH